MRKIETKQEREKRERRNKTIIGIILVVVMVLSTAGYAFFSGDKKEIKKIEYNNFKFELLDNGRWYSVVQNNEFVSIYNPKETENITGFLRADLTSLSGKPLYFSFDSDSGGLDEISGNLGRFAERVQYACLEECPEQWPVKSCYSDNIIIIKESNETLIKQEGSCFYVYAPREEILRVSDALIFKFLGLN